MQVHETCHVCKVGVNVTFNYYCILMSRIMHKQHDSMKVEQAILAKYLFKKPKKVKKGGEKRKPHERGKKQTMHLANIVQSQSYVGAIYEHQTHLEYSCL